MGVENVSAVESLPYLHYFSHQLGTYFRGIEGGFDAHEKFFAGAPDKNSIVVGYFVDHC